MSKFDEEVMSPEDYAAVQKWGDVWGDGYKNGNQTVMNYANEQANAIRAKYDYYGGADGATISPVKKTNPVQTSTKKDSFGGGFSYAKAPTYADTYSQRIDTMLNQLLNRDSFSYDPKQDEAFLAYKQQYQREGNRAMNDTLASVASGAGGMNSYAVTAAQQANDYYATQLTDKIPELAQLAYQMYLDDIELKVQDLGLLENASDRQYSRYRDTLANWRDDRDFAYGAYRDNVGDAQWQTEFDYGKNLAAAQLMGEAGDFSGYQGVYGLSAEQVDKLQESYAKGDKLTVAQILAQAGDYSGYEEMFNLTPEQVAALSANHDSSKLLTAAELMAQAGDFSGYKNALNLTDEQVAALEAWYQQQNTPKVTSTSQTPRQPMKDMDYDGLFAAAAKDRNPEVYIRNHYKDYGFDSVDYQTMYDMYHEWANEQATGGLYGFAKLNSGGGDEAIIEQAKAFVNKHPDLAWNSRTVDYYLEDSGLTSEERALFKEYLKEYAPTWGTNAK